MVYQGRDMRGLGEESRAVFGKLKELGEKKY
jgi:hypothetical protein